MSDVTIPEDVMDIARNVASAIHLKLHRAFVPEEGEAIIARALLAEREAMRERCAMIADVNMNNGPLDAAQAIRSSHE